jgi:RNA polymerase sigma-70 factor (ECF subfamily)
MSDPAEQTELLIRRATNGDSLARRDLLEHYRDYLRRMVAARLDRRLAPRIDASDVVQETLADAADRLDEYLSDPPLPFFGWLRVLAGEHVREAHRKHLHVKGRSVARESRMPELNDVSMVSLAHQLAANDTSPSNRLIRYEDLEWVKAGLAALPAHDREIIVMRYIEALSSLEISQALGTTETDAKNRLYRALMRLRNQMEGGQ